MYLRIAKNTILLASPATVVLDVLQSKNAVAQVILLSYYSLLLIKVT